MEAMFGVGVVVDHPQLAAAVHVPVVALHSAVVVALLVPELPVLTGSTEKLRLEKKFCKYSLTNWLRLNGE